VSVLITREMLRKDSNPELLRLHAELVPEEGLVLLDVLRSSRFPTEFRVATVTLACEGVCPLLVLWNWLALVVERALARVPDPEPLSLAVAPMLRRLGAGEAVPKSKVAEVMRGASSAAKSVTSEQARVRDEASATIERLKALHTLHHPWPEGTLDLIKAAEMVRDGVFRVYRLYAAEVASSAAYAAFGASGEEWFNPVVLKGAGGVVRQAANLEDPVAHDDEVAQQLADVIVLVEAVSKTFADETGSSQQIAQLLRRLKCATGDERRQAIESLGELGADAGTEALATILNDAKAITADRCSAARALGKVGGQHAADCLIGNLSDAISDVREAVASGLGKAGDRRATEALMKSLMDGSWEVRDSAVLALGSIGDPQAVEQVIAALADRDDHVFYDAAHALVLFRQPETIAPVLMKLLKDGAQQDRSRQGAAHALVGMVDPERALKGCGYPPPPSYEPIVPELSAALGGTDPKIRKFVTSAAVSARRPEFVAPLAAGLKDPDPKIRGSAAKVLGYMGNPLAVDALIDALKDTEWGVRQCAVLALGLIKDRRAIGPLQAAATVEIEMGDWIRQTIRKNFADAPELKPKDVAHAKPEREAGAGKVSARRGEEDLSWLERAKKEKLCLGCTLPLGFFDRLLRRASHPECVKRG